MAIRRLTKKGYKIRRTRRINQVRDFISNYDNLKKRDVKLISELLTQNVQTKAGLSKSKRLQSLIAGGEYKKINRFKDLKGISQIKNPTIKSITSLLQDSSEFYIKENELIDTYNSLNDEERENKKNKVVNELQKQYYSFTRSKNQAS